MALEKLYTAELTEIRLLANMLEQRGIAASVQGEILAVARGDLPLTPQTLPSVFVNAEDMPQALEVFDEFAAVQTKDADAPKPACWKCPNCGEEIEGQFTDCWKCQTARPETT